MSKQVPQKSRLGRGLSSLINTSPAEPVTTDPTSPQEAGPGAAEGEVLEPAGVRVLEVPIERLAPNPHQPRRQFHEGPLKELADSLRTTGMIQPVVARVLADGSYELIAGERRWRAAKIAGLTTLPVLIRSVDPVMQAQMALVENLQRQDLNPIERAQAYKALIDNLGLTQAELADRLGEDRTVITHFLRLLSLTPPVQDMVADGRLSISHAKLIAGMEDPAEQLRLAQLVIAQGLNVRNLERLLGTPGTPPAGGPKVPAQTSAHLLDLEKTLSRTLGMRVQLKAAPGKKKGRLILHYASLDQFDELMSKLGIAPE